jgi:hypothetical protein
MKQNQELFVKVCGDIVSGNFSTAEMKDCREV